MGERKRESNVNNLTGKISVTYLGAISLEPTQRCLRSRLQKKCKKVQYWIKIIMLLWKILAVFQKKHCVDTHFVLLFSQIVAEMVYI